MLVAHGYWIDEEHTFEAPEAEVVKAFLETRRAARLVESSEAVDRDDVRAAVAAYANVYDYLTGRYVASLGPGAEPGDQPFASVEGSPGPLPKAIVVCPGARVFHGSAANV